MDTHTHTESTTHDVMSDTLLPGVSLEFLNVSFMSHKFKTLTGITTVTNQCHPSASLHHHVRAPPRALSLQPPPHISHPTRRVAVNVVIQAQRPPSFSTITASKARWGQCDALAADAKNGWRNGEGYITFGKSLASSPSLLIPATS